MENHEFIELEKRLKEEYRIKDIKSFIDLLDMVFERNYEIPLLIKPDQAENQSCFIELSSDNNERVAYPKKDLTKSIVNKYIEGLKETRPSLNYGVFDGRIDIGIPYFKIIENKEKIKILEIESKLRDDSSRSYHLGLFLSNEEYKKEGKKEISYIAKSWSTENNWFDKAMFKYVKK